MNNKYEQQVWSLSMNSLPTGSAVRTSHMLSVFMCTVYLIDFLRYTYVSVEIHAVESDVERSVTIRGAPRIFSGGGGSEFFCHV